MLAWVAAAIAGAALVVASFLPAFALRFVATIGAGDTQRGFDYERRVAFVPDLQPVGLVPLVAGSVVVLAATVSVMAGPRWWLTVLAFVVSLGPGWILLDTPDRIQSSDSGGVTGYDEPHGGLLLQPPLDELKADARRSPEAAESGWELRGEDYYAARGLTGWRILAWTTPAVFVLTAYLAARLTFRPSRAALLVAAATTLIVFVWLWNALESWEP